MKETAQPAPELALSRLSPVGTALLDELPALVAFIDTERKYRYVNRVCAAFFGRPASEIAGMRVAELIGAEQYTVAESYIRRALQGESITIAAAWRRVDGLIRDLEVSYQPRTDSQGILRGVGFFAQDVTERAFLSETRARLAAIVDSSDDAIVSKTLDGIITSWNRSAERMFGYSAQEAIGRHITLIIPPERHAEEVEVLARLSRGENIEHFQTERRAKDGRTLYISLSVSPVRDAIGKIIGASKVARDITEQKFAEQALHATEEYRRAVLESMPECVKVLDRNGVVVQMNAAGLRMVEATVPDQVIGQCVYPLIHEADLEAFRKVNESVFHGGSGGQLEFAVRGLQGTERIFETNVVPLRGGDAEVIGALSVTRDITDRKRTELRDAFLVRLHDATRSLSDPREITGTAARLLAEHLDAERCTYAVFRPESRTFEVTGGYDRSGNGILGRYSLGEFGADFERHVQTGETYVADGNLSVIAVPLIKDGQIAATVMVQDTAARRWRSDQVELVKLVASRFWDSIERARAERDLRESEQQFSTLANAIPNLAWIAHANGHIFWYNRRWYEYTGTAPEEMEGWGWQSVHDPAVLPDVMERWTRSIKTGEPFEMIFPLRGQDGQYRAFLTRVEPIRNQRGRVVRWFGTNTDVTAQEEAQHREKRARETAEILNRVGPVLTAELDIKRLAEKITQIATQAVRAEFGALLHADTAGETFTVYAVSGTPPPGLAAMVIRENGETVKSALGGGSELAIPVRSRNGLLIGALVFGHGAPGMFSQEAETIATGIAAQAAIALDNASLFEETTRSAEELRRTNEHLRRLNEDLNQFAYSASHDLREPLRMVSIYTQLLGRKLEGRLDEDGNRFLDFVLKGAKRLEALIRDLLAYTKTASDAELKVDSTDANRALNSAVTNLETAIEESGARIHVSEPLPHVAVAEIHLTQVLQNLIGNAVKYRGFDTPEVSIGAVRRGDYWEFFTADNGIGIAPEYQNQIFGIFKRLHNADEYSGTGIGLAICQRIVQRYGGRIWVDSVYGRGSTFYFTLPAAD